jgi:Bacterial Ig domain
VANDTTAPIVAMTSPSTGSNVNGSVTVRATATDDIAVASVQFLVDGVALAPADTAAPYDAYWPTPTFADGWHTVTAVARDAAGNAASASVTVKVDNDNDDDVTTGAVASLGAGVPLSGTTDGSPVDSVQYATLREERRP